jgi:anti-sigma factor RsiW
MNHLGDRLSALVDGELNGLELDRANAHLASCETCRGEASVIRLLKRELHALADEPVESAMIDRLVAMAGPGGPIPPRRPPRMRRTARWRRTSGPYSPGPGSSRPESTRSHRGYAVAGAALGIAVIGIGAAAFNAGGGNGSTPAPRITPPMQYYTVEHAITTGDVPMPAQSGSGSATTPP